MLEFQYLVVDSLGIHARPAGLLVQEALKRNCKIVLTTEDGKTADLKKIFAVMSLGVKPGTKVTVRTDGTDEAEASTQLLRIFQENL